MIEDLINASNLEKGLFIMVTGIAGVFIVLILFYILIKSVVKLFPESDSQNDVQ